MKIKKKPAPKNVITSLTQYLEFISEEKKKARNQGQNEDFLFRGQSSEDLFKAGLARNDARIDLEKSEGLIFEEFKRCALPLLKRDPKDDWEWLALAQHHGLPTRLMDWSYSAISAIWFAVNKDSSQDHLIKKSGDGIVHILKAHKEDFNRWKEYTDPFSVKYTCIYRPPYLDSRIVAQQGVFTVHAFKNGKLVVENFEKHRGYKSKIVRLCIPRTSFATIRSELSMLGANAYSIFPDLQGLCTHLKWRFFKFKDE